MARMGKFNTKGFKDLQKNLNKLQEQQIDAFVESCAKELAARLLARVIKRTPVGQYSKESGKTGGTLRRGWTIGEIKKNGNFYKIEIINPVEYGSYVEYGHRQEVGRYVPALGKKLKRAWVEGKHMMTISEEEIETIAPKVLENKLKKFLGGVFK